MALLIKMDGGIMTPRGNLMRALVLAYLLVASVGLLTCRSVDAARIKDIAAIQGVRSNQLVGYGLVVGLQGTGDKQGTEFTIQSLVSMLERLGINVDQNQVKVKNVAAVMVTGNMPPFARIGSRIDINVSSIGDAKSLEGGTLLLTPLKAVDNKVYALAQGPIAVGGFGVKGGDGGGVKKNHLLVARIGGGATVEREIPIDLNDRRHLTVTLFNPDFTTALRMTDTINRSFGSGVAQALDAGTIELKIPASYQDKVARLLSQVEVLDVSPDMVAKVIVNEKTGTVVIGENVRISTVAVSHGNLSISIQENYNVSQPAPFSNNGKTVVTPDSNIEVREDDNQLMIVPSGSTIGDLVRALNAIGVTPRDLISIFQSIKAAGALQAELEII
jgi:flagellar P-ring protein precursor FlgI